MVDDVVYPKWLRPYLSREAVSSIEQAVADVEKLTTGEVVPMIVSRSSAIGHVPLSTALLLALMWSAVAMLLPHALLIYWAVAGLFAVPMGALWLSRLAAVQRLFTTRADRAQQVSLRAELERLQAKMITRRGTGILLFASLMERRAVVLADEGIASKLPQETWKEVVRLLVEGMRNGEAAEGFISAVNRCGAILAEHFPVGADDQNELPNGIIIKI